jgi:hypothetical protein
LDSKLVDRIRETLSSKTTIELLKIWEDNDKDNFSEEAFEAARQILVSRNADLPQQKIYRKPKQYEKVDNATETLFSIKAIHHRTLRKFPNWQINVKPSALLFIDFDDDEYILLQKEDFKNISIKKTGFIYFDVKTVSYVFEISEDEVPKLKDFIYPPALQAASKLEKTPFGESIGKVIHALGWIVLAGTIVHLYKEGFPRLQGPEGTTWYSTFRIVFSYIIMAGFALGIMKIGSIIGKAFKKKEEPK